MDEDRKRLEDRREQILCDIEAIQGEIYAISRTRHGREDSERIGMHENRIYSLATQLEEVDDEIEEIGRWESEYNHRAAEVESK